MASFWGTSEMGNWTVVDYEWNNDSAKRQKMPKTIKMAFPFYQYSITPNNLVYIKWFIQYYEKFSCFCNCKGNTNYKKSIKLI